MSSHKPPSNDTGIPSLISISIGIAVVVVAFFVALILGIPAQSIGVSTIWKTLFIWVVWLLLLIGIVALVLEWIEAFRKVIKNRNEKQHQVDDLVPFRSQPTPQTPSAAFRGESAHPARRKQPKGLGLTKPTYGQPPVVIDSQPDDQSRVYSPPDEHCLNDGYSTEPGNVLAIEESIRSLQSGVDRVNKTIQLLKKGDEEEADCAQQLQTQLDRVRKEIDQIIPELQTIQVKMQQSQSEIQERNKIERARLDQQLCVLEWQNKMWLGMSNVNLVEAIAHMVDAMEAHDYVIPRGIEGLMREFKERKVLASVLEYFKVKNAIATLKESMMNPRWESQSAVASEEVYILQLAEIELEMLESAYNNGSQEKTRFVSVMEDLRKRLIDEIGSEYVEIVQHRSTDVGYLDLLSTAVSSIGLEIIQITLNQTPFDSRCHNSIMAIQGATGPIGTISSLVKMGYKDIESQQVLLKAEVMVNAR